MPTRVHDFRRDKQKNGRELRAFKALGDGIYAAEGVGEQISIGDTIIFSLKNEDNVGFALEVIKFEPRPIPIGGWKLQLVGPPMDSLVVHQWGIMCDLCEAKTEFSFAAPQNEDHTRTHTRAGRHVNSNGWKSTPDGYHLCDECLRRPIEDN